MKITFKCLRVRHNFCPRANPSLLPQILGMMKDYRGWVTSRSATFVRHNPPEPHLGTFSRSRKPMARWTPSHHPHCYQSRHYAFQAAATLLLLLLLTSPAAAVLLDVGMAIFRSCLIAAENASNYPNDSIPPDIPGLHAHIHIQSMQFWRSSSSEKMCKCGQCCTEQSPASMQPFCFAAERGAIVIGHSFTPPALAKYELLHASWCAHRRIQCKILPNKFSELCGWVWRRKGSSESVCVCLCECGKIEFPLIKSLGKLSAVFALKMWRAVSFWQLDDGSLWWEVWLY